MKVLLSGYAAETDRLIEVGLGLPRTVWPVDFDLDELMFVQVDALAPWSISAIV